MITQEILQAIKNKDIEAINKFKKEIEKVDIKKYEKELRGFIKEVIIESKKSIDLKLKIAINSVLNWKLTFYFGNKMKSDYRDFVFENILHSNGQIRQQAVKIGDNFIKKLTFPSITKKKEDYIINIIKELLSLIEEYKKKNQEDIERKKPCQYKSLMLLLESITFPDFLKQIAETAELEEKIENYLRKFYEEYLLGFDYPDVNYNSGLEEKKNAYYDAMEMLEFGDWGAALDILKKTLKRNKDYIELYVGLASVYRMIEDNKSFEKIVEVGFEKLKDKFPEWPKKMFWGYINNRQFLRIIDFKACLCFEKGDKKQAEKLYKLLLKLNPNDNQGIRYFLAGLYENISPKKIHNMFEEGDKKQDWDKIENLFDRQNKIYKFFKYKEEKNENEIVDNNKKNAFYWKIN